MKVALFIVFENFRGFYWTVHFFPKRKHFGEFWELLSNNTTPDTFSKKNCRSWGFLQQLRFFSRKTISFPKNPNLNIFENFETLVPFETHCSKKLLGNGIEKSIPLFLDKTHVIFQKAPNFELSQFSEAIIPFKTHSRKFRHNGWFGKNVRFFSEIPIYISKISTFWIFSDLMSNKTTWTAIWKKDATFTKFEKKHFFSKETIWFAKNQILNVLEILKK